MLPLQILSHEDSPAIVVNPRGQARICIVCEHASGKIPTSLGDLGLSETDRYSHAVWDIGAENLARKLAERFDAPLVLGGISRLVYDCNRPPERADAIPSRTELIEIPGNKDIPEAQRTARISEVYDAFHATLTAQLDAFASPPALVTIHTFTPSWHGAPRSTEIGILHDADAALANAMMSAADKDYLIELNMPYSAADGVTHMLARHGVPRGLRNVMIEVRNDLLGTTKNVRQVADSIEGMLTTALENEAA